MGVIDIDCVFANSRLEPFIAMSLMDTELQRNPDVNEADLPVQLVMVNALTTDSQS